jgi:hypothetical protein
MKSPKICIWKEFPIFMLMVSADKAAKESGLTTWAKWVKPLVVVKDLNFPKQNFS